jgi:hypothetical protein
MEFKMIIDKKLIIQKMRGSSVSRIKYQESESGIRKSEFQNHSCFYLFNIEFVIKRN